MNIFAAKGYELHNSEAITKESIVNGEKGRG